MDTLIITDSERNEKNIAYIYSGLSEILSGTARRFSTVNFGNRTGMEVLVDKSYSDVLKIEIEDKIADVICISYKYDFFNKNVHLCGLSAMERHVFICALLSADLLDDKAYVKSKISGCDDYSIDGIFNFRLTALKSKWQQLLAYVPKCYDATKVKDFINFTLDYHSGRRVFVENGKVFDSHFRRINRAFLLGGGYDEANLLCDILLSACSEAELLSPLPSAQENCLKEYLGSKIIFGKTYFYN